MESLNISVSWSLLPSQDYLISISLHVGNMSVNQLFQTIGVRQLHRRELKQATLFTLQSLGRKKRRRSTHCLMPLTELPRGRIYPQIGLAEKSLTAEDFSAQAQLPKSGEITFGKHLAIPQLKTCGI